MIYWFKKNKTLYVLFILIIIISFFISFFMFITYTNICSIVVMLTTALLPFILTRIYYSSEENKYQVIMSIVYHKYVENDDDFLRAVINSYSEYTSQVKQAYDELFEKMTKEEWQEAIKKFYKFKQEFEEANKLKEEKEKINKRIEYKSIFERTKWLFDYNLKDEK